MNCDHLRCRVHHRPCQDRSLRTVRPRVDRPRQPAQGAGSTTATSCPAKARAIARWPCSRSRRWPRMRTTAHCSALIPTSSPPTGSVTRAAACSSTHDRSCARSWDLTPSRDTRPVPSERPPFDRPQPDPPTLCVAAGKDVGDECDVLYASGTERPRRVSGHRRICALARNCRSSRLVRGCVSMTPAFAFSVPQGTASGSSGPRALNQRRRTTAAAVLVRSLKHRRS